jgi:threonine aldolase
METIVDLRSDTVSHPTPAMREAMYRAEVGDDVMGEDPTINRLEQLAAERMGKESGLFVPSGTMGNLAAVLTHCQRGEEAFMGNKGHTFLFEAGGISALGGVFPTQLPNQPDGTIHLNEIDQAIRGEDIHQPVTRLLILENTHNRCGGVVLTPEYIQTAARLVHARGVMLHLDGARIFNAAAALGISAAEIARETDSVTFCLSKGLCAPVGSVLCGSADFVNQARRIRKQLGGGMRQAGIVAAAGIVALEQMTQRLAEDHARAKRLADRLAILPGVTFPLGLPQTNMVFMELSEEVPFAAPEAASRLKSLGVKVGVTGPRMFRMVLHYWVDDAAVDRTVDAFKKILSA